MKILCKHPNLVPVYVDAFAGTGYRDRASDDDGDQLPLIEFGPAESQFVEGSTARALSIVHPFSRYIFVERSRRRVAELEDLKRKFEHLKERVDIVPDDANAFLQNWCANEDWSTHRAVVFLDPFGMQVEWPTIQCLARTDAVDLWYLFPLSAVNRLLTNTGIPRPSWVDRLNRIYGSPDWIEAFYPKRKVSDLFGDRVVETKRADFGSIADFTVGRLRTEFPVVAPNPRVLLNEKRSPLFLLCFAAASQKPSTQKAALRIASHILKM